MTNRYSDLAADCADVAELIHLDTHPGREPVSVSKLLREARELVRDEARTKSLDVIVVGVDDEVFVDRAHIVHVVGAMLLDAIRVVPPRGRVAVTAQEIERELVIAVFDSGKPCSTAHRFGDVAMETAPVIGGRIRTEQAHDGNLTLFSVPLYGEDAASRAFTGTPERQPPRSSRIRPGQEEDR